MNGAPTSRIGVTALAPAAAPLREARAAPIRELQLFWLFIRSDFVVTVPAGLSVTVAAIVTAHMGPLDAVVSLAKSGAYFCLYVYGHTLANQLVGVEEDRINKPWRPLPRGLVTRQGVVARLVVVTLAYAAYALWLGVLKWTLLWIATYLFMNFHGHKHWFTKNCVSLSLGIVAMMGAGWEIVRPMQGPQWSWLWVVASVDGVLANIQDFRDMEGDRLLRRHTLPFAIGETRARVLMSVSSCIGALLFYLALIRPAPDTFLVFLFGIPIVAGPLVVAARLLALRDSKSDHDTYMIVVVHYCVLFLVGTVLF